MLFKAALVVIYFLLPAFILTDEQDQRIQTTNVHVRLNWQVFESIFPIWSRSISWRCRNIFENQVPLCTDNLSVHSSTTCVQPVPDSPSMGKKPQRQATMPLVSIWFFSRYILFLLTTRLELRFTTLLTESLLDDCSYPVSFMLHDDRPLNAILMIHRDGSSPSKFVSLYRTEPDTRGHFVFSRCWSSSIRMKGPLSDRVHRDHAHCLEMFITICCGTTRPVSPPLTNTKT
jgi:hypothetical protein